MKPDTDSIEKLKQWSSQEQEHSDQSILEQIEDVNSMLGAEEQFRQNLAEDSLKLIAAAIERGQERADKTVIDQVQRINDLFDAEEQERNKLLNEGHIGKRLIFEERHK
jgi:hypothetical protein